MSSQGWLPFAAPEDEVVVAGAVPVHVTVRKDALGVSVRATVGGRGRAVEFDLAVRGNALDPPYRDRPRRWDLRAARADRLPPGQVFGEWVARVEAAVAAEERRRARAAGADGDDAARVPRRGRAARPGAPGDDIAEAWAEGRAARGRREQLEALRAIAAGAAAHARSVLDRDAARCAARFPAGQRLWLCQRLEADRTGRLRQAAETAPWLVAFACACAHEPSLADVARRVVADLVAGRKLTATARAAVDLWASRQHPGVGRVAGVGIRPPAAPEPDEARAVRTYAERKLALLRRAGRCVRPALLLLPPPHAFRPEDVPDPADADANARWFDTVYAADPVWARAATAAERDACTALSRFVAAHADAIRPDAARRITVAARISHLFDFLVATGRRPGTDTDPARLFAECDAWNDDVVGAARRRARDVRAFRQAVAGPARGPRVGVPTAGFASDRQLPEAPFGVWDPGPGDRLEPVRDVAGLDRESAEMRHCVAGYAGDVLARRCLIVTGTLCGRRVTVEVQRAEGRRLEVRQARGCANTVLTSAQSDRLAAWLSWARAEDARREREGWFARRR